MLLLQEYNQFQVKQLTKLIEVTRTDLKKEDRQKVMNMITIDAHSRDMVESIAESGIDRCTRCFGMHLGVHHALRLSWCFVLLYYTLYTETLFGPVRACCMCSPGQDVSCRADCFQWMCQLRSYWDSTVNDCRIRICDATFPYGSAELSIQCCCCVTVPICMQHSKLTSRS